MGNVLDESQGHKGSSSAKELWWTVGIPQREEWGVLGVSLQICPPPAALCLLVPDQHSSRASSSSPLPATHGGDTPAPSPRTTRFCTSTETLSLGKSVTGVPGRGALRFLSAKGIGSGNGASWAGGEPSGGRRSTRKSKTPRLCPQGFATCESVYFIGWGWKNRAPAETVEQNLLQQPLAGSCQLPFLQHASAWDPAPEVRGSQPLQGNNKDRERAIMSLPTINTLGARLCSVHPA